MPIKGLETYFYQVFTNFYQFWLFQEILKISFCHWIEVGGFYLLKG